MNVQEFIYDKTVEFLKTNDGPDHIVFNTFPGSGKTTTVMKAADEVGAKWIYVAPTHDIIEENLRDSRMRYYDFMHLKSKAKLCINPNAYVLFRKGYEADYLCKICGMRSACPYLEQQRRVRENVPNIGIVHTHLATWLPKFLSDINTKDDYNVLILDENPIMNLFRQETLTHAHLSILRTQIRYVSDYDTGLYEFLGALQQNPLDYDRLRDLAGDVYQGQERAQFMERYTKTVYERYLEGYYKVLPRNLLGYIYTAIDDVDHIEHAFIWGYNGIVISVLYRDAIPSLNMHVIGLDGTASTDVWSRLLGTDNFRIHNATYYYGKVYQLNGPRLPIRTWRQSDNVKMKYTDLIRKIASTTSRNVLVIATKYIIENILVPRLRDVENITYAYYYNLRSKNGYYRTCDTVVLVCEPNPHPITYKAAIGLSGWDDYVWKRIYTIDEMKQAIGRLRGNIRMLEDGTRREEPRVFILPSTGVRPNGVSDVLKEAIVVSYNTLVDILDGRPYTGDIELMKQLLAALPMSMAEFSRLRKISYSKTRRLMKKLVMMGYAEKEGNKYRRTERAPRAFEAVEMG